MRCSCLAAVLILAMTACGEKPEGATNAAPQKPTVQPPVTQALLTRAPAVAGLFYPKDPRELSTTIERFLAAAPTSSLPNVRALICPHAGYEYSGPVAAYAYKTLAGRSFDTVIILAASHYAAFEGVSVPAADAYETPLGKVPVSEKAKLLAKQNPFVLEPKCYVQRPPWSRIASKPAPPASEDTPETWEHSVEVQVPFLQKTLKDFKILPVIFGEADPEAVARRLAQIVDDKTLVVASTDLSHYRPYDEAREMDGQTVKWICDMNIAELQKSKASEAACGRMPVLALMHLAKLKGWLPRLLDYRNSGDTAGDKSGVVGYTAIAFGEAPPPAAPPSTSAKPEGNYSAEDRKWLLSLARRTLASVVTNDPLPSIANDDVPAACKEAKGCFVTLTENGQLRGCVGSLAPEAPLYRAVMQNARAAALHDYRFPPVTQGEVARVHVEISVLTEPQPLKVNSPEELLNKLQPHQDGVVLEIDGRSATFLPQVWEQLPDKVEFLNHLSRKAGCEPGAWRGKDISVSIYHVEAFEEPK